MISVDLAKELRSAGLAWRPSRFDFFHIPDRHLDDELFVIADLSIDVQRLADGIAAITFNGAVEWSLDYILTQDVIWLPSEQQLRDLLADRFRSLEHTASGFVVRARVDTDRMERFVGATAADAYGAALLATMRARH